MFLVQSDEYGGASIRPNGENASDTGRFFEYLSVRTLGLEATTTTIGSHYYEFIGQMHSKNGIYARGKELMHSQTSNRAVVRLGSISSYEHGEVTPEASERRRRLLNILGTFKQDTHFALINHSGLVCDSKFNVAVRGYDEMTDAEKLIAEEHMQPFVASAHLIDKTDTSSRAPMEMRFGSKTKAEVFVSEVKFPLDPFGRPLI